MNKTCALCQKNIPETRKASAIYCSDVCYNTMKIKRSSAIYNKLLQAHKPLANNDIILANLYLLSSKDITVTVQMLEAMGFNWAIYVAEQKDQYNKYWRSTGKYRYTITKNNTINIWKN